MAINREKCDFAVRLRYDREDWDTGAVYRAGSVVEVDEIGDPPGGIMAVRYLVISGTTCSLDYDDYDLPEED